MQVKFLSDYQKKILYVSFLQPTDFSSATEISQLRDLWLKELKSWHSPYRALIDGNNVYFSSDNDQDRRSLNNLFSLLEKLFLKKALGYNFTSKNNALDLPFEHVENEDIARSRFGLDRQQESKIANFRDLIHIDNHFSQYFVEISFLEPATFDTSEKIKILKSKLTNNLMQWHSSWHLLIDGSNLEITADIVGEFESMLRFFHGFFLKETMLFGRRNRTTLLPIKELRVRHQALAILKENANGDSGADANCNSRKSNTGSL